MEILFDELSNRSSLISISCQQGLQTIRIFIVVSAESYTVVMGLLFILGTLAQVRAHSKDLENPPKKPLDVLLLGHHLRRLARTSKTRRRPSPI
jgi:hypothetical protein